MFVMIAVIGVGLMASVQGVSAQDPVHNESIEGVDANETLNLTVDVEWADDATDTDSATIEVDHVKDAENETIAETTTETVDADPGNWSTTELELEAGDEDVEEFDVTVTSDSPESIETVDVIREATGAFGGALSGSFGIGIVLGAIGLYLITRAD